MNYLNKETQTERHPHADLIIQWANNTKLKLQIWRGASCCWEDINHPRWNKECLYRIKPEPKPDVIVYTCIGRDVSGAHHTPGVGFVRSLPKMICSMQDLVIIKLLPNLNSPMMVKPVNLRK